MCLQYTQSENQQRRSITARWPKHICLFLAQNFLPSGASAHKHEIGDTGKTYCICAYKIVQEREGSVHCLKYSFKFQGLNSHDF